MADDPYTQVYNFFWETLTNTTAFTDIVKVRNRPNLTDNNREPYKTEAIWPSDFPYVRIEPVSNVPNYWATSDSSTFDMAFAIQVSTADIRLDVTDGKAILPLVWEIHKAIFKLGKDGTSFVVDPLGEDFQLSRLRAVDGLDSRNDDELDLGTGGWSTVIGIEATIYVPHTVMEA